MARVSNPQSILLAKLALIILAIESRLAIRRERIFLLTGGICC